MENESGCGKNRSDDLRVARTVILSIFCGETSEGSLLRRSRDTSVLWFQCSVSLLNDLKLCVSRGLAAVADRTPLLGTVDAYKTYSRYNDKR
jgi:hypothetical protein